jgi:hypothetical protein
MDSREEVNRVLAEMGEPPLGSQDIVQAIAESAGDVADQVQDDKPIELLEPPGHRRANIVFLNGRFLYIDMQEDELLAKVDAFLDDPNPKSRYLTLPIIDTVNQGKKDEIVVAAPIHLTRKALELLQSIGRSWVPKVPGESVATGKVAVVRGSEAEAVVAAMRPNREQRRRLQFGGRERG